ncbi:MAG: NADH-quinone oxidoreductase subunit C [Planctomycetota bacterium]
MSDNRLDSLVADFESCTSAPSQDATACYRVGREELHALVAALKEKANFETVIFATAIDRLPAEPRFEMHYMLLSLQHSDRIRIVVPITEDDAKVPTLTDLYPGVNYFERECYDMFGIEFTDHPALERLLMPDGYGHHPLRKEFPHQGIEPDRLYREWERNRAQL